MENNGWTGVVSQNHVNSVTSGSSVQRDPPFSILILFQIWQIMKMRRSSFIISPNFLFFYLHSFLRKPKNSSSMASSSMCCFSAARLPSARSITSPSRLFPVTSFSPRSPLRSLVSSSSGSRLRFSPLCVRDPKGTDDVLIFSYFLRSSILTGFCESRVVLLVEIKKLLS